MGPSRRQRVWSQARSSNYLASEEERRKSRYNCYSSERANSMIKMQGKWKSIKLSASHRKLLVCIIIVMSAPLKPPELGCLAAESLSYPPRITIQPNDLIATEGGPAELNCDAEGEPEPSIEWYHNGHLIKASSHSRTTMGGSIQFLDIRPPLPAGQSSPARSGQYTSDTGIYYCLARNPLGQAQSRNATLQVAYIRADFKAAPRDKLVPIGDTATLDCLPQAYPEPHIQWRRNGQLIEPNEWPRLADGSAKFTINRIAKTDSATADKSSTSSNGEVSPDKQLIDVFGSQLVIKQVDKNDEARYTCLVEVKGSHKLIERESPGGQLQAAVKPYFIEAPEHKAVYVGGQVKLRCRMAGDPEPVISWRKQNGQPLSEKTQIDPIDKTLTMDAVSVGDQGVYVCEGENPVGSARALATVAVNSRPKFILQPEDAEVDAGARVQLKCVGEASPQPMLFWYKEGHRQLMFAPTTASSPKQFLGDWPQAAPLVASGEYRPGYTSDTSPAINKLFSMPINSDQLSPPSFSNNYFNNRIYVDNQGTLNIVNVTASDNGYYACALISTVGSVLAKAKLTVKQSAMNHLGSTDYLNTLLSQDYAQARTSSSSIGPNKYDLLPPPVIKLGAANQTLPTNTSATLVCEVVSQVAYKIQWFFENQSLQEEPPRVIVLENGALGINNLRTSDSGTYTCVVTAATDQQMSLASPFEPLDSSMLTSAPPVQQSTSHSTFLKVASPMNPNIQFYRMDTFAYPSSPGPAYLVANNGSDGMVIAWTQPADSGSLPIKEYVVEHYDTSQEHLGWREIYRIKGKEFLLIDGLSSEGSHFFVTRAANSHGTGPSSAIAGPMRTEAGEKRYQAELRRKAYPDGRRVNYDATLPSTLREDTSVARDRLMNIVTNLMSLSPISSTSIKLKWSTQLSGNLSTSDAGYSSMGTPDVDTFLEGFSIRFRPIGIGQSLLSKDPLQGAGWNTWTPREPNSPSFAPLVTSYIDEETTVREKRDTTSYADYSQEFNEVRVVEHSTEHYTINGLKPFTSYQFFVVPYFKDIDGVPSNILTAQTNEDRPSVAPHLIVRPINNTAVRLIWTHVRPEYANGILRSYTAQINRSDVPNIGPQAEQRVTTMITDTPITLNLPFPSRGVTVAPLSSFSPDSRFQATSSSPQHYVVMYDLTNLTYRSFYSVQIAATTSVGSGPWSDAQNFVMDPKVLAQLKMATNEFDDIMLSTEPQSYGNMLSQTQNYLNVHVAVIIVLIAVSVILVVGYLVYQRNNQKVLSWKKTISEHFTNKFYMPSSVDHRGPGSLQQNIYDHQQHLIYSANPHISHQTVPTQALWSNNGGITSSGTESLSSQGGILTANGDPNNMLRKMTNEQVLLMNDKDLNPRFIKPQGQHAANLTNADSSRSLRHLQNQNIYQGDHYSVINSMDYEELDQQRGNIQLMTNGDRHQTASSNSDTSCPSSVTRLLPGQNYNRDLIGKTFADHQRHEMILQQQLGFNDGAKQPFATMINPDMPRLQPVVPLSPYATTNLMNHAPMSQQIFSNPSMSIIDQSRQQNFIVHNGVTVDDSSKALMNHHQQANGMLSNNMSAFRTLQRNPVSFQARSQQFSHAQPQVVMQSDQRFYDKNHSGSQYGPVVANITANPLNDLKSNLYEHIDYSDNLQNQHVGPQNRIQQQNSQPTNDIISSSASSGSMKSSSQQQSPEQSQTSVANRFRRGSAQSGSMSEAHDLRVFSSQNVNRQPEVGFDKARVEGEQSLEDNCDEEEVQPTDETTAFRQKSSQSDNQRTRQLSKRKRQQQRNRLHNNNQKMG